MGRGDGSPYDELYDRYFGSRPAKAGTGYERLTAAAVRAVGGDAARVTHDVRVRAAGSGARTQIDVRVHWLADRAWAVGECKDYGRSGRKVGVGIARQVWSVKDDVGADDALIVTTAGFTAGALKYCTAKGILPVIVRVPTHREQATVLREVHVRIPWAPPTYLLNVTVEPVAGDTTRVPDVSRHPLSVETTLFHSPDGATLRLDDLVTPVVELHRSAAAGTHTASVPLAGWRLIVDGAEPVPISGLTIDLELRRFESNIVVRDDSVAELLVDGLADGQRFVRDRDLQDLRFAPDGTVVPGGEA